MSFAHFLLYFFNKIWHIFFESVEGSNSSVNFAYGIYSHQPIKLISSYKEPLYFGNCYETEVVNLRLILLLGQIKKTVSQTLPILLQINAPHLSFIQT